MRFIIPSLIILGNTLCFSQTEVLVFSGINFPTFPLRKSSFHLQEYWHNGINIGASAELQLRKNLRISASFECSLYLFDDYAGPINRIIIPEQFVRTAEGETSYIYRLLVQAKFFNQPDTQYRTQPFILTGIGYTVEDIGEIDVVWGNINGPDSLVKETFASQNYFVHMLGIGLRWPLTKGVALNLEGKVFTNYRDRLQNSWNLGIVFN